MFGDRLRELRKCKNLTQEEIGSLCNVGKATISNWENNLTDPPIEIIIKLANYFGVSIDYLLGNDKNLPDTICKVNQALREAGLVNNDETLKEEEIRLALDQARQYKILMTKILDTPTKYQEDAVKEGKNKNNTN